MTMYTQFFGSSFHCWGRRWRSKVKPIRITEDAGAEADVCKVERQSSTTVIKTCYLKKLWSEFFFGCYL